MLTADAAFAVAVAASATLTLSLLLPFVVRPWLMRLGIMDVPNERSSHERPVLRGLGLAVLIAMLVGGAVGLVMFAAGGAAGAAVDAVGGVPGAAVNTSAQWPVLLIVGAGGVLAGLLGLSEDLRGLSVPVRSAALLVLATAVAVALLWVAESSGGVVLALTPQAQAVGLGAPVLILLAVYAVLFVSSYINVANFMDGLNGISGFHGVIAGVSFAFAGLLASAPWLVCAGAVLATGFAGFLPWNLTKPGAFLGDVGSYLLGGAVAMTSFAALVNGVPVLATIGPMVIYFGDVGVTLTKRVRAGHKWDEPHKEHVYQRLQQRGMSHAGASGVNALFTLAASALGLASFFVTPGWWWLLLAGGLALVVLYQSLPRLLPPRGGAPG